MRTMRVFTPFLVDMNTADFANQLITWQRQHGRHNLPWQTTDPYRVWLSEIMLQQTQVATVLDYYPKFINQFPTVQDLAAADQDAVLQLWAGLGYYSRARNLHRAAQQVVHDFGGNFPQTRVELEQLYGVGRSTAAAIAAFAFGQRETILDGNVKRVLCRVFGLDGNPSDKAFDAKLWALAEQLLPENQSDMPSYIQGLMDLGAMICKRNKPLCEQCPMAQNCVALADNRVAELPRRKTPIAVQQMSLFWLILRRDDGAIWLEKRPQKGIWAGLYCVPCFDSLTQMTDFAKSYSIVAEDCQEYAAFTHKLTHRLLEIMPFVAMCRQPERLRDGVWVLPEQLGDWGMPKPLSVFLQQSVL